MFTQHVSAILRERGVAAPFDTLEQMTNYVKLSLAERTGEKNQLYIGHLGDTKTLAFVFYFFDMEQEDYNEDMTVIQTAYHEGNWV